uniref:Uncharacterized protein n=1 Tax=Daphnia galeata TaxID=27404 RepID=A0A8J2S5P1_9CRUS|nr:unnamed protein product [Daphnia galeata]
MDSDEHTRPSKRSRRKQPFGANDLPEIDDDDNKIKENDEVATTTKKAKLKIRKRKQKHTFGAKDLSVIDEDHNEISTKGEMIDHDEVVTTTKKAKSKIRKR